MGNLRRIYVEKREGFDVEARNLLKELREILGIGGLESVRIINRYDISDIDEENFEKARRTIFSEPPADYVYDEDININGGSMFAVEYLPGQYDQRADSAAQCVQILTQGDMPVIRAAKVYVLYGDISDEEMSTIKSYCINSVDSREASLEKPATLSMEVEAPDDVMILDGFIEMDEDSLENMRRTLGLAMSREDLAFCQGYFREDEKRNPTITEIRVIDTYWSDHCRHTTFLTSIDDVKFGQGRFIEPIKASYERYLKSKEKVYTKGGKDISLMDIATIAMKELRSEGRIPDLDISDEINACSIVVDVDVDGKNEEWLVMFKNETHNHPTEIEPFGGAATCLGGAIRDPLSGRAYVYQAMRVTGSGDPRASIKDTMPGKLPQRKITTEAAAGYSSYGNQIGLATGHVEEIYDEGFVAKRMEIGAVVGAVPKANVVRKVPEAGDMVILLGGRTGRDGCGGATGSSKEHTEESILNCGAEVQKGNAPVERKLQRLFRNREVSRMIKRCNDFGAGGVSVAIGELSDGLEINLDVVPKKYEGLDGTELAISESQERMAVVVDKDDVESFINHASAENLEATVVARVTGEGRLRMLWRGKAIVDLNRSFLNTNGVRQHMKAEIVPPDEKLCFFENNNEYVGDLKNAWMENLEDLNVCSRRGLVERFDSTIGGGTVLMPFGGKYQKTPAECMAAKIPVVHGETNTGTIMSFGYDPALSKWSPYHGAIYAVVEAISKVAAAGGDWRRIRMTFQEYFEKLGSDSQRWGKPLSSLLGAYHAQMSLGIPSIGGKDSMSGTFKDLNVPPTLVAFALCPADVRNIISPEFKEVGSTVVLIKGGYDEYYLPQFEKLIKNYDMLKKLICTGKVLASHTVCRGGIATAVSKMGFGNGIGMKFTAPMDARSLFLPDYGSVILEVKGGSDVHKLLEGMDYRILGQTIDNGSIEVNNISISLDEAMKRWEAPLENVFPTRSGSLQEAPSAINYGNRIIRKAGAHIARPKVFIPVFPGTNCENDTAKAFERAGGDVELMVIRNISPKGLEESLKEMASCINRCQIVAIPGGFSSGDEPDGSGKFIAAVFRNPEVKESVMRLLKYRDGLMIGICNGFQALIKLGLVPYGEIRDLEENSPTLTFNNIGRHVSRMVNVRVSSVLSPWFGNSRVGEVHTIAVSHGEGRFTAPMEHMNAMIKNGQIATQYVDLDGNPSMDEQYNPNGSLYAVEGITSPDGRVLGKMGHNERMGSYVSVNVPGERDYKLFQAGIDYFK